MKYASGILPIAADTKKLCLAWRSPEIREGDRWGIIGGMQKANMDLKATAILELAEETGYSGPLELHQAFIWRLVGFEYHSFVGIVPTAFQFNPEPKYAWENSFLEWFEYQDLQRLLTESPLHFHKGVVSLFKESKSLIERFLDV